MRRVAARRRASLHRHRRPSLLSGRRNATNGKALGASSTHAATDKAARHRSNNNPCTVPTSSSSTAGTGAGPIASAPDESRASRLREGRGAGNGRSWRSGKLVKKARVPGCLHSSLHAQYTLPCSIVLSAQDAASDTACTCPVGCQFGPQACPLARGSMWDANATAAQFPISRHTIPN